MKRDLVSNASRPADLKDFEDQDGDNKKVEEDLRSLRSEFDYGSKKKFVDVLGNVTQASHLNRLRQEHDKAKWGKEESIKSTSYKSHITKQTGKSGASKISNASY